MLEKLMGLYQKHKEVVNYLIVGVLTTVVSLVVYYGLVLTVLDPENAIQLQVANVISWICAVAFAYFANRKFVFESKDENMAGEATKFVAGRVGTLLMDMGIMFVGCTLLHFSDKIVKLFVQVVVIVGNYVISKFLVFTGNKEKKDRRTERSKG